MAYLLVSFIKIYNSNIGVVAQVSDFISTDHGCILIWGCTGSFVKYNSYKCRKTNRPILQITSVMFLFCLHALDWKKRLSLIVVIIVWWLISFPTKEDLSQLQVSQNVNKVNEFRNLYASFYIPHNLYITFTEVRRNRNYGMARNIRKRLIQAFGMTEVYLKSFCDTASSGKRNKFL